MLLLLAPDCATVRLTTPALAYMNGLKTTSYVHWPLSAHGQTGMTVKSQNGNPVLVMLGCQVLHSVTCNMCVHVMELGSGFITVMHDICPCNTG